MRLHDAFRNWLDRRALVLTAVFAIMGVCIAALMLNRPPPEDQQTLPMPFIGTHDIIYEAPSPEFCRARVEATLSMSMKPKVPISRVKIPDDFVDR